MREDVARVLVAKIFLIGLSIVSSVITARYLEPEGRGYYYLLITLAALIAQSANLGLQSSNTYYVSRNDSLVGELYSNSLWVSLISGSVVILIGLASIHVLKQLDHGFDMRVIWSLLLVPVMLFYLYATNLLIGLQRFKSFNLMEITNKLLAIVGMVIAGILSGGVEIFVLSLLLSYCICAGMLHFIYFKTVKLSRFQYGGFKDRFSYGAKAYIATFLGFAVLKANIFFTGIYLDSAQLGLLSIASQIGDMLILLPSTIAMVILPKLIRGEEYGLGKIFFFIVIFFVAVGVFLIFFGELIITLLYGAAYKESSQLLLWYLPAITILGLISIVSQYIAAITIPWALNAIWFCAAICILPLTYFFITDWGAIGAINALTIVYALVLIFLCLLYRVIRPGNNAENVAVNFE